MADEATFIGYYFNTNFLSPGLVYKVALVDLNFVF
jgi:hypothetical protein